MSVTSEAAEAVLHYKRKLSRHLDDDSPEIVLHCLDKLEQIPVNISILQDTGIGKVVNHLKKSDNADESIIEKARSIVQVSTIFNAFSFVTEPESELPFDFIRKTFSA
jgi:hypothetical protein